MCIINWAVGNQAAKGLKMKPIFYRIKRMNFLESYISKGTYLMLVR